MANNIPPFVPQLPFAHPVRHPQVKPKTPAADGFGPATTVHLSNHATEVLGGGDFTKPQKPND